MKRPDAKFAVSRTDVWCVLTLSVFIGMILVLAVRTPATADQAISVTLSSTTPADRLNPL